MALIVVQLILSVSGARLTHAAVLGQDEMISRVIEYRSRDINTIHTRKGYATIVILPDEEDIAEVAAGDSTFWVIDAAKNFIHIKAAKDGVRSNVNILTKKGNVYSFLVAESASGVPIDVRVTVELKEHAMRVKAGMEKPEVPASAQPDPPRDAELRAAKDDAARLQTKIETVEEELARTRTTLGDYPTKLQLYDHNDLNTRRTPFYIVGSYTDGVATYVRVSPIGSPRDRAQLSFYEVDGGKEGTEVKAEFRANTYVIHKVLTRFYVKSLLDRNSKEYFTLRGEN